MKKLCLRVILPIFLAFIAVSAITFTGGGGTVTTEAQTLKEQKDKLSDLKSRYAEASAQAKEVRNKLESTRESIKSNTELKFALEEEITAITGQIATAEALIKEYDDAIKRKENEKETLERNQKEQFETLGEMMRVSYMYGDESYIDIILGSKDIGDFLQRLDYISYHMNYSQTLIDEINATVVSLEEVTNSLQSTRAAMEDLDTELKATKAELEPKVAELDALLITLKTDEEFISTQYDAEIADTEALEKEMEAMEKAIAEEEERLRKEEEERRRKEEEERRRAEEEARKASGTSKPASSSGNSTHTVSAQGLIWPLENNRPTSSSYGYRRDPFTGKTAFHNGLDIPARHGTEILAAKAGTVTMAKVNGTYGNCVILNHGGGLITLYAHCSGYNVKVGDKVEQGDVIAFVGSTGRSTGNHLHFVVRINGEYKDPSDYLPKR